MWSITLLLTKESSFVRQSSFPRHQRRIQPCYSKTEAGCLDRCPRACRLDEGKKLNKPDRTVDPGQLFLDPTFSFQPSHLFNFGPNQALVRLARLAPPLSNPSLLSSSSREKV